MVKHAYIDESGTMDYQGMMSVGMIVLEGVRSAERLHEQIMVTLNPKYFQLLKQLKNERKSANAYHSLHFSDMSSEQKRVTGKRLAAAQVIVYTAHYWHEGDKTHDERFAIYTDLIRFCVKKAFVQHTELVVGIAKQGGWQAYERDFIAKLRTLPDEQEEYRKAEFKLLSAVKPGIQLADFYVGAVRDFVMDESARMPYDLVQDQIACREIHTLIPVKSER